MNKPQHWLVIDQGGQSSRVMVFDAAGQVLASAARPIQTRREGDRVEHDGARMVAGIADALAEVLANPVIDPAEIAGAGLATQRSSIICWDRATGAALSPVLSWQDRRAAGLLNELALDPTRLGRVTGLVASPHYGAGKMRWCLKNLPDVAAAAARGALQIGPLSSYLLQRLLGERPFVCDPANASRTLLWDVTQMDWSDWLLNEFGIARELLPRCVSSRHDYGHLGGGPTRIPLIGCTGDQAAALFATGQPAPGQVFINMGTGAFLQTPLSGDRPVEGLLHSVVWQDADRLIRVSEGTVNGGASAVKAEAGELGLTPAEIRQHIEAWLATAADLPVYLNGVSGLGSPFWVPDFRSGFVGEADTPQRMVAVYESLLFLLRVNLGCLTRAGEEPTEIIVTGGLSRIDGLCQRLANLTGLSVHRAAVSEATARGMAWLLGGRSGGWATPDRDSFHPVRDPGFQARFRRWSREMAARLDPAASRFLN